jgi:Ni/Co efflux regulator RcnB
MKNMKKIALAAIAAIVATVSLASSATAASHNDEEWRRDGRHHDRGFNDGNRHDDGNRHQDAGRHDSDRHGDRWRRHHGWRHDGWRHDGWRQGYWGGPRVVIVPEYDTCFIKKVRRYDDWGNVYIKRVRVCR